MTDTINSDGKESLVHSDVRNRIMSELNRRLEVNANDTSNKTVHEDDEWSFLDKKRNKSDKGHSNIDWNKIHDKERSKHQTLQEWYYQKEKRAQQMLKSPKSVSSAKKIKKVVEPSKKIATIKPPKTLSKTKIDSVQNKETTKKTRKKILKLFQRK